MWLHTSHLRKVPLLNPVQQRKPTEVGEIVGIPCGWQVAELGSITGQFWTLLYYSPTPFTEDCAQALLCSALLGAS